MKETEMLVNICDYIILSTYDGTCGFSIFVDGHLYEKEDLQILIKKYDDAYYHYKISEQDFYEILCIKFKKGRIIHCCDGRIEFIVMEDYL